MWGDNREKKMLAERKKKILGFEQVEDQEDKDKYLDEIKSFQQHKKSEDESVSSKLADYTEPVVQGLGKAASKVGDYLKDAWYSVSTPRWKQEEERKKKNASKE